MPPESVIGMVYQSVHEDYNEKYYLAAFLWDLSRC